MSMQTDKHELREPIVLENEGMKIFGVFHKPAGHKKFPSVLICHGLAGHKTGRYRVYVNLANELTRHGVGVLRVDFRGSGDSEGEFFDMTLSSEVSDALISLEYLKEHPQVDVNRIGIFGRSLGGSVATITASRFPGCKSLVLWAPIYSGDQWRHLWYQVQANDGSPEALEALRTINGQVAGDTFFKELFTMQLNENLEKIKNIPLLHIHGDQDATVLPVQATYFHAARQKALAPSKFIRLPHADHDFTFRPELNEAIKETCQWFEKTL